MRPYDEAREGKRADLRAGLFLAQIEMLALAEGMPPIPAEVVNAFR